MLSIVYFVLIVWTMFWAYAWALGVRRELASARPGPRADLLAVARAYAAPAVRVTCTALLVWGWLPAAVLGAMWLAGA